MAKYILKRIITAVVTVFLLATITFFLLKLLPGNPFASEKMQANNKAVIYAYYGFDKPIYIQYLTYLKNLIKGDLGYSYKIRGMSVNTFIMKAFPYSLNLGLRAIFLALFLGLLLGICAAYNRNKPLDSVTMIISVVGISVPGFVIGFFIQYIFAAKLRWFPVARYDSFSHTILPTLTLSLNMLANIAKYTRTSMLDVIYTDYIKTAESKGISKLAIIGKHQLRNALLPVVTIMGPIVASVVTGSFFVEIIFAVPGLGRHFVTSVQNLDYTLVMGLTIFFSVILIGMNLVVDIVYGILDPRIKLQ